MTGAHDSRGPRRAVLVACARDEAPYILDWICHHAAIGFDAFHIYYNDNADSMLEILEICGKYVRVVAHDNSAYVEIPHYPEEHRRNPQMRAYWRAQNDPDIRAYAYVAFLDVDEYLTLRHASDIHELLAEYDDLDGVAINWRCFGSGGETGFSREPVTRRFRYAAPRDFQQNTIAKSLVKTSGLVSASGVHYLTLRSGESQYAYLNRRPVSDRHQGPVVDFSAAQINHYYLKSPEDYLLRSLRGDVRLTPGTLAPRDKYNAGYYVAYNRNEEFDDTVARHDAAFENLRAQFLSDPRDAARLEAAFAEAERRIADNRAHLAADVVASAERVREELRRRGPPGPRDLASSCRATQSSVSPWSTSPNPEIDAAVATNGDLVSPVCFHTAKEINPWWRVDLGAPFLVSRITIHNRPGFEARLKAFTILRSHNLTDWFEVHVARHAEARAVYDVELTSPQCARYVQVRLDGVDFLHLREVQIFGRAPSAAERAAAEARDEDALARRRAISPGREGVVRPVGGFHVFIDEAGYGERVAKALRSGDYETRERRLVAEFLAPGDRVLEIGTAVGVVAMTAAAIVGAANVVTFEANGAILEDARANFARNGLADIQSHVAALACRAQGGGESAEFFVSRDFWASRLGARRSDPDIVRVETIPVRCLEDELARHQATVLICDIEGGEVDLLTKADLAGVRLIVLETHYWLVGEGPTDAMIRALVNQGFDLHLTASGAGVVALRRAL